LEIHDAYDIGKCTLSVKVRANGDDGKPLERAVGQRHRCARQTLNGSVHSLKPILVRPRVIDVVCSRSGGLLPGKVNLTVDELRAQILRGLRCVDRRNMRLPSKNG
jgi:hypothetical protein